MGVAPITALLVMDLQRDFLQPNGRLPIDRAQVAPVIAIMNAALDRAARAGLTIIYVANAFDFFDPSNLTRNFAALRGSPGAELDPRVTAIPGAIQVQKKAPNAFTNPAFAHVLAEHGVKRLIVGGVFADACVTATCRAALARGFAVSLLADGIGAANERVRRRSIDALVGMKATLVTPSDL